MLIDAIDDEQTLYFLKEDLAAYTSGRDNDALDSKQLEELDKAIKDADTEYELRDWQSFKSELKNRWKER